MGIEHIKALEDDKARKRRRAKQIKDARANLVMGTDRTREDDLRLQRDLKAAFLRRQGLA